MRRLQTSRYGSMSDEQRKNYFYKLNNKKPTTDKQVKALKTDSYDFSNVCIR
jgi:hypothetical protein